MKKYEITSIEKGRGKKTANKGREGIRRMRRRVRKRGRRGEIRFTTFMADLFVL